MHRRACSCIRLTRLTRVLWNQGSSLQEIVFPRFVNAQPLSGKTAHCGCLDPLKVSASLLDCSQLWSLAQHYGKAKVAL